MPYTHTEHTHTYTHTHTIYIDTMQQTTHHNTNFGNARSAVSGQATIHAVIPDIGNVRSAHRAATIHAAIPGCE